MLTIKIPGNGELNLTHLVLDYNGTLAIDGILIEDAGRLINGISQNLTIHVVTGDTFLSAKSELKGLPISLVTAPRENQAEFKLNYIRSLGPSNVVSIGNGCNDSLMLKYSVLGICVLQKEGTCIKTLVNSDIVVKNIIDAFDLLISPKRLIASLRG